MGNIDPKDDLFSKHMKYNDEVIVNKGNDEDFKVDFEDPFLEDYFQTWESGGRNYKK